MTRFFNIRHRYRRLVAGLKNFNGNPRDIALGMAIGVFISATPFFPFHTSIAIVLAFLLKGSRIAAAAGVWVSNPVTLPFFYITTYKTGAFFLGITSPVDLSGQSFSELLNLGVDISRAMILGGIIIGFILSLAAYFATLRIIEIFKNRRIAGSPLPAHGGSKNRDL